MARVIYKFGGTSVGDTPAAVPCSAAYSRPPTAPGTRSSPLLSAQAGATDALLARGREIDPDCAGREADSLLSTGEQVSVSLCALALARLGVPAVSLCGWQMGLQTDGSHGSARCWACAATASSRELRAGRVVLAAGFQGVDAPPGDITDARPAAVPIRRRSRWRPSCTPISAASIRMSTVSMTATRVCIPTPVKYGRISYDDMLLLARGGARVLA